MDFNILNKINTPDDVKKLNTAELKELASNIREALLRKVSTKGGHFGPNLGMVEATIAMHYVFNSPVDKIVYDVSHQSYPHKMLTGRKNAFTNPEEYHSVTGYTSQHESEHDFFTIGHTSTSVSLACGLAKARDVKGEKGNVIAVIGDGSLSGGEAYEGLNNAAELENNMIIVVNDNDMSIAENHGGLYKNLKLLRETKGQAENNFFKTLGLDYVFVDGHDIEALIETFSKVKDIDHPIVVHMYTIKGKGYDKAVENKEPFHYTMPFDLETGKLLGDFSAETYISILSNFLEENARRDKKVVGITAATPSFMGLNSLRTPEFKDQYIDVGIAEEHAIALASGMASQGAKPVAVFMSSFIQRTYDQLSQDLAINNNPALIVVNAGGISGADVTHLGLFDIPLISNIPNIVYLAPTSKEEYLAMLQWGLDQQEQPVVVRTPSAEVVSTGEKIEPDFSKLNTYKKVAQGNKVAIIGLGAFFKLGQEVKKYLKETTGIDATLINPRFITGLDENTLNSLVEDHEVVITLEDGLLNGGFGEKIARFYGDSNMKVLNFGLKKEFLDRYDASEVLKDNHLTTKQIVEDIKKLF